MELSLRSQHSRQPAYAARVDWGNPLCRGLSVAINGSVLIDAVSGKALALTGADKAVCLSGVGYRLDANSERATMASPALIPTTEFSLYWRGAYIAQQVGAAMLVFGCDAASYPAAMGGLHRGTGLGECIQWAEGGNARRLYVAATDTGNYSIFCRVKSGAQNAIKLYDDTGAQSVATPTTYAYANFSPVGRNYVIGDPGAVNPNAITTLGLMWTRYLSDGERAEILENPYQVFEPLARRIFVSLPGNIKTLNGLAWGSVKTRNGLAAASIKTLNGVTAN